MAGGRPWSRRDSFLLAMRTEKRVLHALLDFAREITGSDRATASQLGVTASSVSRWRNRAHIEGAHLIALARFVALKDQRKLTECVLAGTELRAGDRPHQDNARTTNLSFRVLVVDDLPDAAESVARGLEVFGHQVRYTTNPRTVPWLVEGFQPHIAFLDIGMPDVNGWMLARRIRAKYNNEALALVALTAYGEDHYVSESYLSGFDLHVLKPSSPDELNAIIARLCRSPDCSSC
jgi:CheY-like chemotaxis protein